MTNEMNIKDELLKQMDPTPDTDTAARILARDAAGVKRIKWLTIIMWSLVAICFAASGVLEHAERANVLLDEEHYVKDVLMALARILSFFAVLITISYYIRSRTLTISQIQMRLAGIEEQLRKMAQDRSGAQEVDAPRQDS